MRKISLLKAALCFGVFALSAAARSDAPFLPLDLMVKTAPIVDEPLGARSSLGLTLWHLGRDADQIRSFHEFLRAKKIRPETLIPTGAKAPETAARLLVEPDRLPEEKRTGWGVQDGHITAPAGDNGPQINIPLSVPRAGLYAGWVKYYAYAGGSAVTSLRIYRAGKEELGPIVNDEIYDTRAEVEGPAWKSFMVDLAPGDYTMRLGPVVRWWHAGGVETGYSTRAIDLLYFTDEIWQGAPSDAILQSVRDSGAPTDVQTSAQPKLSDEEKAQWKRWQVRPLSWESAPSQPKLFALSREYSQKQIAALGKKNYGAAIPDYRAPQRQVVFDDTWNLVANPVQIRRRIDTLNSDLTTLPSKHFSYWLQAGDFQKLEGAWQKSGTGLRATYGDFAGVASTDFPVDQPGDYSIWMRFGGPPGYYSPFKVAVSALDGQQISWDNVDVLAAGSQWHKIGVVKMREAGKMSFAITPQPFKAPGTYRNIYDFLLTTDASYTPQDAVRPPLNLTQYNARATASGAADKDPYLLWISENAYTPLVQEVWSDASWPISAAQAAEVEKPVAPSADKKLVMTANTQKAVQIGLRSLRSRPIELSVKTGELKGAAGTFSGKVGWRVVGFVPQSESDRDWSPYLLMRRPTITIAPRSAAGVWLTVDTTGVAPGEYSTQVTLTGKGVTARIVTLNVQVAPAVAPQQKVLVGGWTSPPEGEIYRRDYQAHGMNIWYGEISKAEMKTRGIELVIVPIWSPDEANIRAVIDRMKKLGLNYDDWMFSLIDEPHGTTEAELKPFLDLAKAIRKVDAKTRISFNPGEAASLATFQILDPYADFWLPYTIHRNYPPGEAPAKVAIFSAKPWMFYTTPDLYDKSPDWPGWMYGQIREVPAQPGKIRGTAFFAFYYPFRDAWDAAHEHIPDVGVTVLPSRHGPVATRAWEAIREGIQAANLAQALREKIGAPKDEAAAALLTNSSTEELLGKLQK